MSEELNQYYSGKEERLNVITHAFGLLLSVIGLPFLILKAFSFEGFWKPASLVIYGLSLIVLYAASTFYHAAKDPKLRRKFNIFDHAAIYVLIAGTYSPYTIILMDSTLGWTVFGLTWSFALVGIILKLFFTGRFDKLSTALYLLMGWQVVFVIKSLMEHLSTEGTQLLFAGGVFYTIGALLYSINRIPYNHAIFHVCVVLGSLFHFFSVFSFL
ncbi:hemolysin III family protein [Flavobacteriaceae bacterium]|nr:hemolysin III family protein [Flavobacteriaceae bacterium]MDC1539285.1 hemolysin III family protein [Flavobacteriaceae bacterium]